METKECHTCGDTIIRGLGQTDYTWRQTLKCVECRKNHYYLTSRGLGGNKFWQALNFGDIPPSMTKEYEERKRLIRQGTII